MGHGDEQTATAVVGNREDSCLGRHHGTHGWAINVLSIRETFTDTYAWN